MITREAHRQGRCSVNVDGFSHGDQPIPAACRVGPLIVSGGIYGLDPKTGKIPEDLREQVRLMFDNLSRIVRAAGGALNDIAKVTVYVRDTSARNIINQKWVEIFPDEASRPARHMQVNLNLPPQLSIQCDFIAYTP
ncbi:MAG: endoribonuclease L-PSP [Parvularcula sp.]|nr:endoribonuclease L-PSP [Parvularcula sp.]